MSTFLSMKIRDQWGSQDSGGGFKLKFVASNPIETATAEVWKEQQSQAIKLEREQIKWVGLEGLLEKKIKNLLLKFKDNFEVTIDLSSSSKMTVRLKRLIHWNMLSLQSTNDLVSHLKKGLAPNRDIEFILSRMVSHFTHFTLEANLPPSFNEEILAIFPYIADEEKKTITRYQELIREYEEYTKQAFSAAATSNPPSLFVKALQDHIPWIGALRKMKEMLTNEKEEQSSANHALKIKKEISPIELNFFKNLRSLLKSKSNKVILIQGPAGCGKTTYLKDFALHYLNKYRAKTDPIALFIPFHSIKNPVKGLIDQTLEDNALYPYQYELKSVPTLWIIDGVDPLNFNLYQTNEFDFWPKAQVVISCRKESLKEWYQQHLDPFSKIRAPELKRDVYFEELEIPSPSHEEKTE